MFLKVKVAAQPGDVTLRRSSEKLLVLAAKIGRVFVASLDALFPFGTATARFLQDRTIVREYVIPL